MQRRAFSFLSFSQYMERLLLSLFLLLKEEFSMLKGKVLSLEDLGKCGHFSYLSALAKCFIVPLMSVF